MLLEERNENMKAIKTTISTGTTRGILMNLNWKTLGF